MRHPLPLLFLLLLTLPGCTSAPPPKTEADAQVLYENIAHLEALQPSFVSVTYGAGGSTRQLTHDLVLRLKQTTTLDPIPHLTCVCHSQQEIEEIEARVAALEAAANGADRR